MNSILTTIKKALGIEDEYTGFDDAIIMAINTAIFSLTQIGVGPTTGYKITGYTETWKGFLGETVIDLEAVKSHIFLKTRLLFDPPQTGHLVEAINSQLTQLEWRLNVQVDTSIEEE